MIRVLLVEDDQEIAQVVQRDLEAQSGYSIRWVSDARTALEASFERFDVILLDIMLPDQDGLQLCERLRQSQRCPIIFISCLDDSSIIIEALQRGGDDYIAKPFDNRVLHARILANLRRIQMEHSHDTQNRLEYSRFVLDAQTHTLTMDAKAIALLPIEYRILSFLMQNTGRHFMSRELYQIVWGQDSMGDVRTVLVHIHNLRKKLGEEPSDPRFIKNIRGKGYTFDPDGKPE